jgi:hypothetical protein
MQRSHGNAFVQRALLPLVSRQTGERTGAAPSDATATTTQVPSESPGETAGTEAPTEMTSGGGAVRVTDAGTEIEGTTVDVTASMVRLDTPIATIPGVLQVDTLIANSVVGSSYTPGPGNVQ